MTTVAVVALVGKSMGGGLAELREVLADEGFADPLWYEVARSRLAPKYARRAMVEGADVLFVWGGDGTVQRCVDAVAGAGAVIAILPAGTANLLATNLGVPGDLTEAVRVGLRGRRRPLDTGTVNGEHFAFMAGAGLDALIIRDVDKGLKDRIGRAAYVWTGAKNLRASRVGAVIEADGQRFFSGKVSCVLVGNLDMGIGGVRAFEGAQPDDGRLELVLVTAKNWTQWTRTLSRGVLGGGESSPFVEVTHGKTFTVRFDRKVPYELDGEFRQSVKKLVIKVHPASIAICVPHSTSAGETPEV